MSARLALSMLAVLAAGTSMLGCGIEGQPFGADKTTDENTSSGGPIVTGKDISAEKQGSPEHTVLGWWRGLQTRNPDDVRASYAPDVRDALPGDFNTAIVSFLAPAASESSIKIDSVEQRGKGDAVLFATIDSPNAAMDGPLALPMKKDGDEWFLANSTYVVSLFPFFQVEQALDGAGSEPSTKENP